MDPKSKVKVVRQHTRQQPQRLCGIFTRWTQSRAKRNNAPGNGRNDYAEFPPLLAKSRDNTTAHNKPATAATIMRNFHHCWQSRATTQQHTTDRQRPQRLCGISITAGKVARQHNDTQQTGNGRNDYAEFPSLLAKSRDNTTTHNKPAAAATIMRNFRTVSTQKSQRDKTA